MDWKFIKKRSLKMHGPKSKFFYESGLSFENKNPLKKREDFEN